MTGMTRGQQISGRAAEITSSTFELVNLEIPEQLASGDIREAVGVTRLEFRGQLGDTYLEVMGIWAVLKALGMAAVTWGGEEGSGVSLEELQLERAHRGEGSGKGDEEEGLERLRDFS